MLNSISRYVILLHFIITVIFLFFSLTFFLFWIRFRIFQVIWIFLKCISNRYFTFWVSALVWQWHWPLNAVCYAPAPRPAARYRAEITPSFGSPGVINGNPILNLLLYNLRSLELRNLHNSQDDLMLAPDAPPVSAGPGCCSPSWPAVIRNARSSQGPCWAPWSPCWAGFSSLWATCSLKTPCTR